jgi:hypothetical protein
MGFSMARKSGLGSPDRTDRVGAVASVQLRKTRILLRSKRPPAWVLSEFFDLSLSVLATAIIGADGPLQAQDQKPN